MPLSQYALALDVGGSHVTAAVVDLAQRRVIEPSLSRRATTIDDSAEQLIEAWAGAALDAAAKGVETSGISGFTRAGVGMPGPFDYTKGISWHVQKFTSLYGVCVKDLMLARWQGTVLQDLPLRFANDASLWALGEWWLGAVRGIHRVIGVTLGTGLGSGFIADGKIITGGEEVPPGGEIWNTPYLDDIAENYAAGAALNRAYRQSTGLDLTPAEIAARARAGEEAAQQVFRAFGAHLASIFAPWVQRFQPDCLIVGGNISRAWPLFRDTLQQGLPALACRVTEQFENSSLLGAAAYEG